MTTIKPRVNRKFILPIVVVALGWLCWWATAPGPAWSRPWKPSTTDLARDYSLISDTSTPHEIRMIFWLTPPMVPQGQARQLLDTYSVIGVAIGHFSPTGTISFDTVQTLQASGGDAKPLRLLSGDDIPPTVNGTVSTMTSVFSQSLGAFGKGFHWFVFDAGSVHACTDGVLSVPFAGEVYTFQTPIPGCAKQ